MQLLKNIKKYRNYYIAAISTIFSTVQLINDAFILPALIVLIVLQLLYNSNTFRMLGFIMVLLVYCIHLENWHTEDNKNINNYILGRKKNQKNTEKRFRMENHALDDQKITKNNIHKFIGLNCEKEINLNAKEKNKLLFKASNIELKNAALHVKQNDDMLCEDINKNDEHEGMNLKSAETFVEKDVEITMGKNLHEFVNGEEQLNVYTSYNKKIEDSTPIEFIINASNVRDVDKKTKSILPNYENNKKKISNNNEKPINCVDELVEVNVKMPSSRMKTMVPKPIIIPSTSASSHNKDVETDRELSSNKQYVLTVKEKEDANISEKIIKYIVQKGEHKVATVKGKEKWYKYYYITVDQNIANELKDENNMKEGFSFHLMDEDGDFSLEINEKLQIKGRENRYKLCEIIIEFDKFHLIPWCDRCRGINGKEAHHRSQKFDHYTYINFKNLMRPIHIINAQIICFIFVDNKKKISYNLTPL